MNKIILVLIIFMVAFSIGVPAYADTQEASSLNITLEDLAKMSSVDRESVLQAYNTLKDSQKGTISISTDAKEVVAESVEFMKDINLEGLPGKAEKIAEAIIAFCKTLGVGVEKVLTSKVGIFVLLIVAFKTGMFGTFACCVCAMLFTYILFTANTTKKVSLKEVTKNDEGKVVSITTKDELIPKFNALFTRFTGSETNKDIKDFYEAVSCYRILTSILCGIVILFCIISI